MTRSAQTTPKFEAVTLRLPVHDVEKTLTFYVDKLGFHLGWKWGTPLTHANVWRDSISLDLIALQPSGAELPWHMFSSAEWMTSRS